MFEKAIKRGEISSAEIVRELEGDGFNLHGIERRRFMVDGLGLTVVRSYKIGRDHLLVFKTKDWRLNKTKIFGKTRSGFPLIEGDAILFSGTHDRKIVRPNRELEVQTQTTVEQKIDLLLWAMDRMLQQKSDRA